MIDTISKSELWCEQHDHFKRTCPWCEISEKEAEMSTLIAWQNREMKRMQNELNQAIEALEHIREECSAQGSVFSESIGFFINEILQSIKGGETDATQTSSRS